MDQARVVLVGPLENEANLTANRTNEAVRDLLASAKRTRGGGWSLENLLDAIFLIESAALAQRGEMIEQNLKIIGLLEQLSESKQPESEPRRT